MAIRSSSTKTVKLGKHDHAVVMCPLRGDYDPDERYWARVSQKEHATVELRLAAMKLWAGPRPNPARAQRVVEEMARHGMRVSIEEIEATP